MLKKKDQDMKPAVKNKTVSFKGIKLNASSARLGFIYAELLGPPVSKRRSIKAGETHRYELKYL